MKNYKIHIIASPSDSDSEEFARRSLEERFPNVQILPKCKDEPLSKVWTLRTQDRIMQADAVVCLVGEDTWLQTAVNWQLTFALHNKKQIQAISLSKQEGLYIPPFVLIDKSIKVGAFDLKAVIENIESNPSTRKAA